ncbi:Cytoplasmic protein, partial [Monkeypox virus]
PSYEEIAKYGH